MTQDSLGAGRLDGDADARVMLDTGLTVYRPRPTMSEMALTGKNTDEGAGKALSRPLLNANVRNPPDVTGPDTAAGITPPGPGELVPQRDAYQE